MYRFALVEWPSSKILDWCFVYSNLLTDIFIMDKIEETYIHRFFTNPHSAQKTNQKDNLSYQISHPLNLLPKIRKVIDDHVKQGYSVYINRNGGFFSLPAKQKSLYAGNSDFLVLKIIGFHNINNPVFPSIGETKVKIKRWPRQYNGVHHYVYVNDVFYEKYQNYENMIEALNSVGINPNLIEEHR